MLFVMLVELDEFILESFGLGRLMLLVLFEGLFEELEAFELARIVLLDPDGTLVELLEELLVLLTPNVTLEEFEEELDPFEVVMFVLFPLDEFVEELDPLKDEFVDELDPFEP